MKLKVDEQEDPDQARRSQINSVPQPSLASPKEPLQAVLFPIAPYVLHESLHEAERVRLLPHLRGNVAPVENAHSSRKEVFEDLFKRNIEIFFFTGNLSGIVMIAAGR